MADGDSLSQAAELALTRSGMIRFPPRELPHWNHLMDLVYLRSDNVDTDGDVYGGHLWCELESFTRDRTFQGEERRGPARLLIVKLLAHDIPQGSIPFGLEEYARAASRDTWYAWVQCFDPRLRRWLAWKLGGELQLEDGSWVVPDAEAAAEFERVQLNRVRRRGRRRMYARLRRWWTTHFRRRSLP